MKVFFKRILKMDDDYQEILIDENNFDKSRYSELKTQTRNVLGITYDDIYIIEPKGYFHLYLKENVPYKFDRFVPNLIWVKAGLIISDIHRQDNSVFMCNPTENHIYIRSNAMVGEVL